KNFVKTMMHLTATRSELKVVFDQVGTPTYAGDLAATIYGIIEDRKNDKTGIYHYTNEGVCSWYDFAFKIAEMKGNTGCKIRPCLSHEFPSPVTRPSYSVLDKAKIKDTFEIQISYWTESLRKCIDNM
ncbi:MAG: sugar nucleotide-binding protein, partial [Bacteroidaceae bacterium]|nr:sugar nucleotide-binding protein [Bacteroidaceae bacterium]